MIPLIGVTTSTHAGAAADPSPFATLCNRSYTDWVARAGGAPVLLPNLAPELIPTLLAPLDGLLLTGGQDIHPSWYGAEPILQMGGVDVPRDRFELPLTQAALERGLPVFGICRGVQTLNVALGGTLRQDLVSDASAWVQHRMATVGGQITHHGVALVPGSRLHTILREESTAVNSYHHQAVEALGRGLRIVARAADGTVEAVEGDDDRFLLAVQWHPEVMDAAHAPSGALFSAFVAACRRA
jgi:putative glutamine amidotransferase